MVSSRLPVVHRPTMPPIHSSQPLRASIASAATGASTLATIGGTAVSTAAIDACCWAGSPSAEKIAATTMKKGNRASSDI